MFIELASGARLQLFGATCILAACTPSSPSREGELGPEVVRAYAPLTATATRSELGEDCAISGQSDCKTGFCLHVSTRVDEGYFCSIECDDETPCPQAWVCTQLVGLGTAYCTPPGDWKSGKAVARPKVARVRWGLDAGTPPEDSQRAKAVLDGGGF